MTTLHSDCKTRLRQIAAKALGSIQVENRRFFSPNFFDQFKDADAALPREQKRHFAAVIAEKPFSTFAFGYLLDRLSDRFEYEPGSTVPLDRVQGYEDLNQRPRIGAILQGYGMMSDFC